MVQQQLADIRSDRVLAAMYEVPRHAFVPTVMASRAYEDSPLPLARSQTISQPWIVARMTELLELQGTERVLEIGTGSGYQTAVLASLCRKVVSIERHAELAREARQRLESMGITNVTVLVGDGTMGRSEFAPFDAALITAGAPEVPAPLLGQVRPGGRLVVPVGDRDVQQLLRLTLASEEGAAPR